MKKHGVFKTTVARERGGEAAELRLSQLDLAELEFQFEAVRPYLRT